MKMQLSKDEKYPYWVMTKTELWRNDDVVIDLTDAEYAIVKQFRKAEGEYGALIKRKLKEPKQP